MHGANRLAFEGISMFPTFLTANGVKTVGWKNDAFLLASLEGICWIG